MRHLRRRWIAVWTLAGLVTSQLGTVQLFAEQKRENDQGNDQQISNDNRLGPTATPIEHVIVIIGENRTFDNIYGTYIPEHGQQVSNLLSRGIVNADGTPGENSSAGGTRMAIMPLSSSSSSGTGGSIP
jgi:phospholipase C